jgi:integrase
LIKTAKRSEEVIPFTQEEEHRILRTAKTHAPQYYPFVFLLFRAGLRLGEAIALRPEDLDLPNRGVWVQRNFTAGQLSNTPKSRQKRRVDLAQDLVAELQGHLVVQEAEACLKKASLDGWLFTTPQGAMIHGNNFRDRVWKPLLKAAGVPYRWIHATRHTFATRLIMAGAPLVYVQKQLGHSSIQITVDTYCHWIRLTERNAVLEVDRLMGVPAADGCTFGCTSDLG